jgi:hypothetical protein
MIGKLWSIDNFPRDRLVHICQSPSKADAFEKIVKEQKGINGEFLVHRLQALGINDAVRIVQEVEEAIDQRIKHLDKVISVISGGQW